jgi:hypothetical protein
MASAACADPRSTRRSARGHRRDGPAFALSPPHPVVSPRQDAAAPDIGGIDDIKRRALLRAERLTNIYLDDADSAPDQGSMELAQALAARSIMRLAGLRMTTSTSPAK